jgi:hypothetical protein
LNWPNLIKLIPVVAGNVNPPNPEVTAAASVIEAEAEKIIAGRIAADSSFDRDAAIAEAGRGWEADVAAAEALGREGHETDTTIA